RRSHFGHGRVIHRVRRKHKMPLIPYGTYFRPGGGNQETPSKRKKSGGTVLRYGIGLVLAGPATMAYTQDRMADSDPPPEPVFRDDSELASADEYKRMTLDELLDLEVTLVSKRP